MIYRFKALLLVPVFAAGISFAAPLPPTKVEVVRAEFGIFDASNPKQIVFEPTLAVPHKEGQRYGWVIELRTRGRSVSVREEYLLTNAPSESRPSAPMTTELLNVTQDRHNQISQRQLVPVDGKIYGEWAVGPNEPAGRRHLQVVIEGQVAADFEFDVK